MKRTYTILCVAASLLLNSCADVKITGQKHEEVDIFPDYKEVTVPYNIAPLNFAVASTDGGAVRFCSESGDELVVKIRKGVVDIPVRKWHSLLETAKGGKLNVSVVDKSGSAYEPFNIHVSEDRIDKYVAYRLIEPGYVLWNEMGIFQRDLESFKQSPILRNHEIDHACVNCHSFADRDPNTMSLHVRKTEHGGTYISVDGKWEKLDTKTPQTMSALVYPSWHPGKRYIAYSVNDTKQTFHVSNPDKIVVYDFKSDVVIYDTQERTIITDARLFSSDFETFPAFSNDGSKLYYCTADSLKMPTGYRDLKYSLCSMEFDAANKRFGKVDTLVKAGTESVTMPRMSPDGKYLLYTSTAYGNFTVWNKDADLRLIDLENSQNVSADQWNSNDSESWHSWSGNSRWVVFSTRRDDGAYTRLYIGHIGQDGKLGKAFLLPQRDPEHGKRLMKSYNIPEFVTSKVQAKGYAVRNSGDSYQVRFAGEFNPGRTDASTGASVAGVN